MARLRQPATLVLTLAVLALPSAEATATPKAVSTAPPSLTEIPPGSKCPKGMALVPGGSFTLGKTKKAATVADTCLDLTEVTVAAYEKCITSGACTKPKAHVHKSGEPDQFCNYQHPEGRAEHPINCVDWDQATAYCSFVKRRLPSEEEWEWAARNGSKGDTFPWGPGKPDGTQANACGGECVKNAAKKGFEWASMYPGEDGHPETAPVASFGKDTDAWGVHDLAGNVSEWTSSKADPADAANLDRVARGGNFASSGTWLAITNRYTDEPSLRTYGIGFRCAR